MSSFRRVILVTGSNAGIGYELVHLLAAKGNTVYLASRKEKAGLEAVATLKKEKNVDIKFVQLDVTDVASIDAAAKTIAKEEGRLNVLVNNAGISEMSTPHSALDPNIPAIRNTLETNLIGLIQTTTAFLPLLRSSNNKPDGTPSVILNVSTDMASNTLMAKPDSIAFRHKWIAYNTSKAAMNSYTISLARELQGEGVKVNAITPGFTTTKLNGHAPGGKTAEKGAEMMVDWCLLGPEGETGTFLYDGGEYPW